MMPRITFVVGTRPEAIKLAPVILAAKRLPDIRVRLVSSGQHRDLVQPILELFHLVPDHDLGAMQPGQGLEELTSRILLAFTEELRADRPDLVVVQGDTTTAFAAALASFYQRRAVGHVEAGLRTGSLDEPWPEEANRSLITRLSTLHFAPTEHARQNLLNEGVASASIHVTGNPVIDALKSVQPLARHLARRHPALSCFHDDPQSQLVLVTAHRRENHGAKLRQVIAALFNLAEALPSSWIAFSTHPNPSVQSVVSELLGTNRPPNLVTLPPLPYEVFVGLMDRSTVILTDSGGLQEEAPSLGKPVLVLRDRTERVEAIEAGTVRLIGCATEQITRETLELLNNQTLQEAMRSAENPYGGGHAGELIAKLCVEWLRHSATPGSSATFENAQGL